MYFVLKTPETGSIDCIDFTVLRVKTSAKIDNIIPSVLLHRFTYQYFSNKIQMEVWYVSVYADHTMRKVPDEIWIHSDIASLREER